MLPPKEIDCPDKKNNDKITTRQIAQYNSTIYQTAFENYAGHNSSLLVVVEMYTIIYSNLHHHHHYYSTTRKGRPKEEQSGEDNGNNNGDSCHAVERQRPMTHFVFLLSILAGGAVYTQQDGDIVNVWLEGVVEVIHPIILHPSSFTSS